MATTRWWSQGLGGTSPMNRISILKKIRATTFAENRIRKTRYERTRLPRVEPSLSGLAGFYTLPSREEPYGRATEAPCVPPRHLGDRHHLQRGAAHRRLYRVAPLVRRDPGRRLLLDRPDARDRPELRQGPLLPAHLL